MSEDYLWDKTGEPDPEIQELEEILGTLRYQPRPLEIPVGLTVGRQRNFFRDFGPRLAIAATIAMVLLGLGLWVGLQRLQRHQPSEIVKTPKSPAATPATVPSGIENQDPNFAISLPSPNQERAEAPRRHRTNPPELVRNSNRLHKAGAANTELAEDRRNGEAAKDQLMLALRLASTKISFAQRKTQSISPRDQVHNQHKIG